MALIEYPTEYQRRYGNERVKIIPETEWEAQHLDVLFPGGLLCLGNNGCHNCAEAIMDILEECRALHEGD